MKRSAGGRLPAGTEPGGQRGLAATGPRASLAVGAGHGTGQGWRRQLHRAGRPLALWWWAGPRGRGRGPGRTGPGDRRRATAQWAHHPAGGLGRGIFVPHPQSLCGNLPPTAVLGGPLGGAQVTGLEPREWDQRPGKGTLQSSLPHLSAPTDTPTSASGAKGCKQVLWVSEAPPRLQYFVPEAPAAPGA